MDLIPSLKALPSMLWTSAALLLTGGLAGCGSSSGGSGTTGVDAPVWSPDAAISSCDDFATTAVGDYVISSNYWNKATCPGTQCIEMNRSTGAFSVTQGPDPCGNNVASFPNVLYGCSYGNCSPQTILPQPVSQVASLTSSWDFSVGGTSSDAWNVAYDIWFCPDSTCGASGFPNGLELMIWLDYRNAAGWKDHLGTTSLAGRNWDVWAASMLVGGATAAWNYMDYIVKGSPLTQVTDLDLNAFIQDAVARGYAQSSWYLFAVQAGMEVRKGGIPFTSNSFSVNINGQTPSPVPLPTQGLVCDGGAPVADGQLAINGTYITAGSLHGYGGAWTALVDTAATICSSPVCTGQQTGAPGTCTPALSPTALCTAGVVSADPSYHATAGVGFELDQDQLAGGGGPSAIDASLSDGDASLSDGDASLSDSDASLSSSDGGLSPIDGYGPSGVDSGGLSGADGGDIPAIHAITVPNNVTLSIWRSNTVGGNNNLRAQLTDVDGNIFCYGGPLNVAIPIGSFNTECWNNQGTFATPSTRFTRLDIIVPSSATTNLPFSYCLDNVVIQ